MDKEQQIAKAVEHLFDGEKFPTSFDFHYENGDCMEEEMVKMVMEKKKIEHEERVSVYKKETLALDVLLQSLADLKLQEEEMKELEKEEEKVMEMKRVLEKAQEELNQKRQKLSAKRGIAVAVGEIAAGVVSTEQAIRDADARAELLEGLNGREEQQENALHEKGKRRQEEQRVAELQASKEAGVIHKTTLEKLKEEFIEEYKKANENHSGSANIYKRALLMLTNILQMQIMSPIFAERESESGTNDYILTLLDFIPKPIVPSLTSMLLGNLELITNEFAFLNHFMPFYNRYMECNSKYDSPQKTEWPSLGKSASTRHEEAKKYLESLLKVIPDGVRPGKNLYYLPPHLGWVLYNFNPVGPDPIVPIVGRIIRDCHNPVVPGGGCWFNYRGGDDKGMLMIMHEKLRGVTLVNGERQHDDGDDQLENFKVTMFDYKTIKNQCHLITYAKAVEVFFHAKGSARVKMFKYLCMAQKLEKKIDGYM